MSLVWNAHSYGYLYCCVPELPRSTEPLRLNDRRGVPARFVAQPTCQTRPISLAANVSCCGACTSRESQSPRFGIAWTHVTNEMPPKLRLIGIDLPKRKGGSAGSLVGFVAARRTIGKGPKGWPRHWVFQPVRILPRASAAHSGHCFLFQKWNKSEMKRLGLTERRLGAVGTESGKLGLDSLICGNELRAGK